MPYLLDTNHCSYLMNGLDKLVSHRKLAETNIIAKFQTVRDTIYMSEASLGELIAGAELSSHVSKIHGRIANFRNVIIPVPVDELCWELYGKTKALLQKNSKTITDIDLLIACTANRYGAILVSNDSVFKYLPANFSVENWAA